MIEKKLKFKDLQNGWTFNHHDLILNLKEKNGWWQINTKTVTNDKIKFAFQWNGVDGIIWLRFAKYSNNKIQPLLKKN